MRALVRIKQPRSQGAENLYSGLSLIIIFTLLAGCSGHQTQEQIQANRYHIKKDGKGLWDVDVSSLPDAIPRPPEGKVKTAPYSWKGVSYVPLPTAAGYQKEGVASWYGVKFHGYKTANGEMYDMYSMSAAHKTLPLPSYVRVTNLENSRSVVVRVNDRGPFHGNRLIDLSWAAAKKLGYQDKGTARVRIEGIDTSPEGMLALGKERKQGGQKVARSSHVDNRVTAQKSDKKSMDSRFELPDQSLIYLQVAALSRQDAATDLKKKLLNVTSTPVTIVSGDDALFRVWVGPFGSEQDLLGLQEILQGASMAKGYRVYETVSGSN